MKMILIGHAPGVVEAFESAGYEVIIDPPLDRIESFNVAVIASGWFESKPFMDSNRAAWDAALYANVEAMITAGQAVARSLIAANKGGRIIYLSSVVALKSLRGFSTAGTSLAALHVIARMAAVDLGAHGITVNVVAVGWGDGAKPAPDLVSDSQIAAQIPLARLSRPEDAGGVCLFLASDAAQYITGAVIPVDGGYTLTKTQAVS